jgi:hypothetical protein
MALTQSVVPTFPTVEEMQRMLRQSGILDKATIFPSKSEPGMQAATQFDQIHLANAAVESTSAEVEVRFSWIQHYIPKIVGFLLIVQGLQGIYKSINFLLVEFPQLEMALENHLITGSQINYFVGKAAILAISTFISILFAMHLTFLNNKAAKLLKTAIGLLLVIGNSAITSYFDQQNSGVILSEYSATLLEQATMQVEQFLNRN